MSSPQAQMKIIVRQEVPADQPAVRRINDLAFGQEAEGDLVNRLRKDTAFVPELSLVAETEGTIVGYALLTKSYILAMDQRFETLTLAPVAVVPEFHRKGIGKKLIREGLSRATKLGFRTVNVLGHPDYYPQFGFVQADAHEICCPFEVPLPAFQVLELVPGGLSGISGTVKYAVAFDE